MQKCKKIEVPAPPLPDQPCRNDAARRSTAPLNMSLEEWMNSGTPIRVKELAELTRTSKSTWDQYRVNGRGPKVIYIAGTVFYLPSHFKEWIAQGTASNSAEAIAKGLSQACKNKKSNLPTQRAAAAATAENSTPGKRRAAPKK